MENVISHICSKEPKMGKCAWTYSYKYHAYMCSICGEEFLKPFTKAEAEEDIKAGSQ